MSPLAKIAALTIAEGDCAAVRQHKKWSGRKMREQGARFTIHGLPCTFATSGERAWKIAIAKQSPHPFLDGREVGLVARFRLASLAPRGMPLDIDNLCEPLFSVLVNRLGWFRSSRSNVMWWHASKRADAALGCDVTITESPLADALDADPLCSGCYSGPLPSSARSSEVALWAASLNPIENPGQVPSAYACFVGFGDPAVNIGNIATGPVKSFIDCLFPLLGGRVGAPADHLIDSLTVAKGYSVVGVDSVMLKLSAHRRQPTQG